MVEAGEVLVTGGAGYIGAVGAVRLKQAGFRPVLFDDLSTGHALAAKLTGCELVRGSLLDRAALEAVFAARRFVGVLHYAGAALVPESVRDPAKYYAINLTGGVNLLQAMADAGVLCIVFSSTCATYGQPEKIPIAEDAPQRPINPYGRSKLAFEGALESYQQAFGLRFAALRYFNACGAAPNTGLGEHHEPETHLIPLTLQVPLGQREALKVFGEDYPTSDGSCVRDYIHVEDLAEAHLVALRYLLDGGTSAGLNLGTGRGYSVKQVLEVCRQVTGHPIPASSADRRPGDPAELVADVRRARKVLGWSARHSDLENIVATAWTWHQEHPHGYT